MADLEDYALTTVADVKESLGLASSDTSKDNLIIRKINQATDAIESYCQRRFVLTQYNQEEYNATQIDELVIRQRPIVIDASHNFSLEWRTTAFDANNWETVESDLYFVDQAAGVMNLMFNGVGHWNRYRLSYWAGFAAIPNDLAEAASMLACWYVNNPAGVKVYIIAQQEGNRSLRFSPNAQRSFAALLNELGIDETIDSYADSALLTDR